MTLAHPLRRIVATQSHHVRWTAQVVGGDPPRESGVKEKPFCKESKESKAKRKQKETGDKRLQASKPLSTVALTQAISECAKKTRWQEAIVLFASNTKAANVASFNATMKACQKGTQWQLSTDLLHQITLQKPKPDTISYNTAIDSCKKGRQWPLAFQLFEEMHSVNLSPDSLTFNMVMPLIKEWSQTLHLLERMMEASMQPNAMILGTAVHLCERSSQWNDSLTLLKRLMKEDRTRSGKQKEAGDKRLQASKPLSTVALNQAISECAKETRWQEAIMLFASNTKAADVVSFNATMKACQKGTQWQLSTDLLKQITVQKAKPDTISYNTAIDSCKKGHQWPLAFQLFEEMHSVNLSPDSLTFNTVMPSIKEWSQTLHLLERMMEASMQPNAMILGTAVHLCERSSQWNDSLTLLERLMEEDLTLNGVNFFSGMKAAKKGKHWPWAIYLLQMMPSSQVKPRQLSFHIPLDLCVRAKKWDLALEVFSSMTGAHLLPTGPSIQAVIESCDKIGSWQTALHCVYEALNAEPGVNDSGTVSDRLDGSASLLRPLVTVTLRTCGSPEQVKQVARQLLERMTENRHCDRKTLKLLKARAGERQEHGDHTPDTSVEFESDKVGNRWTPMHLTLPTSSIEDEILWWLQDSVAPELAQRRRSFKCSIGGSDSAGSAWSTQLRAVSSLLRDLGLWATPLSEQSLRLELTRKDLPTLRSCTSKEGSRLAGCGWLMVDVYGAT